MSLECNRCGTEVFEADNDGMFWQDDSAWCPMCGIACVVDIETEYEDDGERGIAHVITHDERVIDVDQPRCDGSVCGYVAAFHGLPCQLDCKRVLPAHRQEAARRIAAGEKP